MEASAPKTRSRSKTRRDGNGRVGFDVVCVVGHVTLDDTGEDHPHVAAFKLIAEHGAEGEFTFPMENGAECVVTVEHAGGGDH